MAWLRKFAEMVEVNVTNPGDSVSGTCAFCDSIEGEPVDEVGTPPHHPHCKCTTEWVERDTTEDEEVDLEDDFDMEVPEEGELDEAEDPGGVEEL